jgi:hypothetical protein
MEAGEGLKIPFWSRRHGYREGKERKERGEAIQIWVFFLGLAQEGRRDAREARRDDETTKRIGRWRNKEPIESF